MWHISYICRPLLNWKAMQLFTTILSIQNYFCRSFKGHRQSSKVESGLTSNTFKLQTTASPAWRWCCTYQLKVLWSNVKEWTTVTVINKWNVLLRKCHSIIIVYFHLIDLLMLWYPLVLIWLICQFCYQIQVCKNKHRILGNDCD